MKRTITLFLIFALLLSLLTSCELMVLDPTERPSIGLPVGTDAPDDSVTPAPAGSAEPEDENYGFTVFPEGNYLADPKFDTEECLPDYDCDASFLHMATYSCSTETTFYFTNTVRFGTSANSGDMLYYADKATGISGPLCGRPECTHGSESCNAYMGYPHTTWGLMDYDGRLYWVAGGRGAVKKIYSAAYDGTDHREIRELEEDVLGHAWGNPYILIHQGYLYWSFFHSEVVNGEVKNMAQIVAFPLDGEQEGFSIFEAELRGSSMKIVPSGNSLYILICNESGLTADQENMIYRWDTRDLRLTAVRK